MRPSLKGTLILWNHFLLAVHTSVFFLRRQSQVLVLIGNLLTSTSCVFGHLTTWLEGYAPVVEYTAMQVNKDRRLMLYRLLSLSEQHASQAG